jgi:hypothetical protein
VILLLLVSLFLAIGAGLILGTVACIIVLVHRLVTRRREPRWVGTVLESCIRAVHTGQISGHSSVTPALLEEYRRWQARQARRSRQALR